MPSHLLLIAPAANRVYAAASVRLAAAELAVCLPGLGQVSERRIAGVDYVALELDADDRAGLDVLARHSLRLGLFELVEADAEPLLRPVALAESDLLDEDLVSIPKYPGKTNELFTRLLLNVTCAQVAPRGDGGRLTVLDPMCGRGTTLSTAWLAGYDAAGVESDVHAVEQTSAFLKTWLRRKRLKHRAELTPLRRDGKTLGKRLEVEVRLPDVAPLSLGVLTGDTRDSASLWGRRTFDAVVTDAPYGVVHGASGGGRRERSAASLLAGSVGGWASQLRGGGALGLAWNTLSLPREELLELLAGAGLEPLDGGPWHQFAHRVDSSVQRDLVVATKPA